MNDSKANSILVLGAGELGLSVLRAFASKRKRAPELDLAILLRPQTMNSTEASKLDLLAELQRLGIRLVAGDLQGDSVETLTRTFAPFNTVIGCTGFVTGSGTQLKITEAAISGRVRRYIPWQFGVDYDLIGRGSAQPLFDEQLDVRDLLRSQSQIEWLIISTGIFTSFLFEPSFGVVDRKDRVLHALGSWDTEVTTTTVEDIGNVTAEVLLDETQKPNEIVYAAGDTLSYKRLAEIVERVEGTFTRRAWDIGHLRRELTEAPTSAIRRYRLVFAEGKGVSWPVEKTYNFRKAIVTANVEAWLRGQ